jgi:timeless
LTLKIKKKKKKARKESNEEEDLYEKLMQHDKDFISQNGDNGDDKNEHTGSVDLSDDDDQYLERDLDPKQEMQVLLDYNIVSKLLMLFNESSMINNTSENFLADLKRENNLIRIINKLFQRVIGTLKGHWVFFQMDYLYIIHSLLNNKRFTSDAFFSELLIVFQDIIKNFFAVLRTNKLLTIESLFRFPSLLMKDSIINNYEYVTPPEDTLGNKDREYMPEEEEYRFDLGEEQEYDGEIEPEKGEETVPKVEKKNKKKVRKHSEDHIVVWTEDEDLLLIENYLEYENDEGLYDILDKMFKDKDKHDIKHRVKTLKLKKGKKKALKMFKKLHKKKRKRDENMFNIIIELSDEFKDDSNKKKFERTINSIKSQLQSYQLRKGLVDMTKEIDCVLIPSCEEEIDTLQNSKFQSFIKNLGFIPPEEQDNIDLDEMEDIDQLLYEAKAKKNEFWKLDSKGTDDIEIMIERLQDFERMMVDNIDPLDAEREEERKKHKKEKKKEKKDKKKKKKDKKEKKRRGSEDEVNEKSEKSVDVAEEFSYQGGNNDFANQLKELMSKKSEAKASSIRVSEPSVVEVKKKRLKKGLRDDNDDYNFD